MSHPGSRPTDTVRPGSRSRSPPAHSTLSWVTGPPFHRIGPQSSSTEPPQEGLSSTSHLLRDFADPSTDISVAPSPRRSQSSPALTDHRAGPTMAPPIGGGSGSILHDLFTCAQRFDRSRARPTKSEFSHCGDRVLSELRVSWSGGERNVSTSSSRQTLPNVPQ